jgi:hypothetical protein
MHATEERTSVRGGSRRTTVQLGLLDCPVHIERFRSSISAFDSASRSPWRDLQISDRRQFARGLRTRSPRTCQGRPAGPDRP